VEHLVEEGETWEVQREGIEAHRQEAQEAQELEELEEEEEEVLEEEEEVLEDQDKERITGKHGYTSQKKDLEEN